MMNGSDLPVDYGRMPTEDQQSSAMQDQELITTIFERTKPKLLVHRYWHYQHTWISAGGSRIEGLGRDDDLLGAMIVWDSEPGAVENTEVRWGQK